MTCLGLKYATFYWKKTPKQEGAFFDCTSQSRFRKTDAFGLDSPSPIWLAFFRTKMALVSRQDSPRRIWMAYFRMRMARFPIENNQDGSPKIWFALRNRSGWHKLNIMIKVTKPNFELICLYIYSNLSLLNVVLSLPF